MDNVRERELRGTLRELKRLLGDGDVADFAHRLGAAATPELLQAVREHKVLLRAPQHLQREAAAALASTAASVVDPQEAGRLERQSELTLLVQQRSLPLLATLEGLATRLPQMSLADLLQLGQKAFNHFAGMFIDSEKRWHDLTRPVNMVEREWHDLNGRIADVTAAVCRAVNACSPRLEARRRLRDDRRAGAEKILVAMVSLCSALNGLDWVRDSAAFGDLDVTSIEPGDPTVVTLEFRDPRRSLLRTLGVRRAVIMESFARRPERVVTHWLEANAGASMQNALDRYRATVRPSAAARADLDRAIRAAEVQLNALDFEDDMIVVASEGDRRVIGRYLLSSLLQWSEAAAQAVSRGLPKGAARRFLPAAIALEDLTGDLAEQEWRAVLAEAWAEATTALPATNHWELVRRPFVLESDGVARPLLYGASGKWNAAIRERLLRGGALAKVVGGAWERYFGDRFREAGWSVLGQGVRLKANGAVVTDIDLLVARDDLLLVVQIKALGGGALNPYDHWKQRKVIEKGCWQAAVARRHLDGDRSMIQAVAGRAAAERVRVVEAIVLTNLNLFDGWEHGGVAVLGETLLKSITVGSKVDYVDPLEGRVVRTRHVLRPEELNTQTIVKALRSPVELVIAPERGAVGHIEEQVAGILFRVPEFTVPEDGGSDPHA